MTLDSSNDPLLRKIDWLGEMYSKGLLTAEELVGSIVDEFAFDDRLRIDLAAKVVRLLPESVFPLMVEQLEVLLHPEYHHERTRFGRRISDVRWRELEPHLTTQVQAWARALHPIIDQFPGSE